jgi:hypothetical protein
VEAFAPAQHARGRIQGVAATSATKAWAIDDRSHENAQVWHWNGRRWSRVATAAINGQTYSLGGVAATSARNAWAVGTSFVPATVTIRTVILHWNGARWKRTPSPHPPTVDGDGLAAVSATSADDAWAVTTNTAGPSLTEQWNGTSWRAVPALGCAVLAGVSILPSGRAWAVGSLGNRIPVILRWNGTSWQHVPSTISAWLAPEVVADFDAIRAAAARSTTVRVRGGRRLSRSLMAGSSFPR